MNYAKAWANWKPIKSWNGKKFVATGYGVVWLSDIPEVGNWSASANKTKTSDTPIQTGFANARAAQKWIEHEIDTHGGPKFS